MNPDASQLISSDIEAPVMEIVRIRKSSRAFSSRPVSATAIASLFEAARWAPSSRNEQPWTYIYATADQPELYQKIFQTLTEGNKIWVQHAPLLIVSMMRKTFRRDDTPNPSAAYDLGAANAFLTLQATAMGLNVRQMAGFYPQLLKEALRVPPAYEVVTVMAVGYPSEPDKLPPDLQQREQAPRVRYRQARFVMNKTFDP